MRLLSFWLAGKECFGISPGDHCRFDTATIWVSFWTWGCTQKFKTQPELSCLDPLQTIRALTLLKLDLSPLKVRIWLYQHRQADHTLQVSAPTCPLFILIYSPATCQPTAALNLE